MTNDQWRMTNGEWRRATDLCLSSLAPRPSLLVPRPSSLVPHRSSGFSLIELLIVMAVMGILVGLVLPRSDPSLHEQLRSAAQIMAADLAYGRSLAVTNNSRYRFTFDTTGNRYILEHSGADASLDTLPDTPFRSPDDPPNRKIVALEELPHLGATVRIVEVAAQDILQETPQPVGDLEFGPLGGTSRAEQTTIWLAAGTGSATRYLQLDVNPVTGLTTVGAYSGDGPP